MYLLLAIVVSECVHVLVYACVTQCIYVCVSMGPIYIGTLS